MSISLANGFYTQTPSSFSKPHLHLCLNSKATQLRKPILCARRSKKRNQLFGSAKSTKLMLESAYFIASKLKILPEPLDLMIREYAGGNGGHGGGGSGGGGFWRGGFDGWGRGKKRKWKFWGGFVILGILGAWVVLGRELEFDAFWGVLGLILFGVSVNGWWMSGFGDWALGFCCCAVLLGWTLKRDDLQRWVKSFGPLKIIGRRRRGRGWAFYR